MDRKLKQISHVRLYSCWLKRVVVLFLVVILQAKGCLGFLESSTPSNDPKKAISLEKKSANLGKRNSKTTKTNDASQKEAESEEQKEQLAKAKGVWDKFKDMSGERLAKLKAYLGKLKKLSQSEQKKQIRELSSSEAEDQLILAIEQSNLKLFRMLLKNQSFMSEVVRKALEQIVLGDLSAEGLTMFNLLLRQPCLSLKDLHIKYEHDVTLMHYVFVVSDIDTRESILKEQLPKDRFCLHVQDKQGNTPLHYYLASSCGDINTWNIILKNDCVDSLCIENNDGQTPLYYLANSDIDIDIWKALVQKLPSDALCAPDKDGRTLLHCLALWKEIKKFEILFDKIKDEWGLSRAMEQLLKRCKKGYSVIEYSYLLEYSNSKTLQNNSNIKALISSIPGIKDKNIKMVKCLLGALPVPLTENDLAIIECIIQYQADSGIICQRYADMLYSTVNDYIKEKYRLDADKVIRIVDHIKHVKSFSKKKTTWDQDYLRSLREKQTIRQITHEKKHKQPFSVNNEDIPYIDTEDEE